jgi:prevent-host-death family protein
MTFTLTIAEAKQKLDELISTLDGNDVILTSNGVPLAKISPISLTDNNRTTRSASRLEELHLEQEFENYENLYPKNS